MRGKTRASQEKIIRSFALKVLNTGYVQRDMDGKAINWISEEEMDKNAERVLRDNLKWLLGKESRP